MGFLAVIALAAAGGVASFADLQTRERAAYDAAPVCSSASDVSSCRFDGQGRIVDTSTSQGKPSVDVQLDELGKLYNAQLDSAYTSRWQKWEVNQTVEAEVFDGSLVKVDGLQTTSNPDTFAISGYRAAAIVALALFVILGAPSVWLAILYRREMQYRRSVVAGEVPGLQPLPITAGTRAILARSAGHPRRLVAWVGAAAFCGGLIVSAAWFVTGVPVLHYAYRWAGCPSVGGAFAYGFAHEGWQYMQDLQGGVFVRTTGPFAVRLVRTRAGTMVVVAIAGRKLAGTYSASLELVQSGTGRVGYLPHSGYLLPVTDSSGKALWPPAGETTPADAQLQPTSAR